MLRSPCPSTAITEMATRMPGKDMKTSIPRMSRLSTRPP